MHRPLRFLILVVISISLGGVVYKVAETLWVQKVLEMKHDPIKLLDLVPDAALQLKDFRRSKVEKGRKIWEVTGEEAVYFKKNKEAKISKPKLIFYHESGEPIEVRGDQGHLYFADREIEKIRLQGKVEIHYQGFVLKTTEIVYLQEQDQVISQGKVAMKGEGLEMEGVGAEISLRDQKIRLQSDVKTRIEPKLLERNRIRPS